MAVEMEVKFIGELPKFVRRVANRGECKYPFGEDAWESGHAISIKGRAISTVKQAVKKWVKRNGSARRFTVREVDGVVIVRRDK